MQNETLRPELTPVGLADFTPTIPSGRLNHADGTLLDKYGRRITYVRLSITDRCDFRCTYCMAEEMTFLPRSEVMSLEECLRIAEVFVSLGVTKLRVTGGEPLVRKDAMWLIERLGALSGLDTLVLTTNGSQLDRFAAPLKAAGVKRINISLDTLKPERFRKITRIGDLAKVLVGIAAVRNVGFQRTKLNTVMMRGINDDEFIELVRFAIAHELDISFIEEMPLGEIQGRNNTYISSEETRQILSRQFELIPSAENSGDRHVTGEHQAANRGLVSFPRIATIFAIPATGYESRPKASFIHVSAKTMRPICCQIFAPATTTPDFGKRLSTAWASSRSATTSHSRWMLPKSFVSCR